MNPIFKFKFAPKGPFDLLNQKDYFGDWISPASNPKSIAMAFPVESWRGSCAVVLEQAAGGELEGQIYGPARLTSKAREQALCTLSLDVNGEKWPDVGRRDQFIGKLQKKYSYLRPVLFHSPYEAAAAFVIGHRTSIKQRTAVISRMSESLGEKIEVNGQLFKAFPLPETFLSLTQYPGLDETKMGHLQAIAKAALDGLLDRERLRALPVDEALAKLRELPGIGPFFAQGILHRGAGLVDEITDDDVSGYAIQIAYQLAQPPNKETMLKIANPWRPFRMWSLVLLHIWLRREVGIPKGLVQQKGRQRKILGK